MEFHVLELSKLPKELKEDTSDILLWAKIISAEREEKFDMLATKNPYIKSAYEQLQVISQDKQKRLEYEAREKAIRDHNQMMYEAKQLGEYEKAISIAKELLTFGIDIDIIVKTTKLSLEQIQKLQQENEI